MTKCDRFAVTTTASHLAVGCSGECGRADNISRSVSSLSGPAAFPGNAGGPGEHEFFRLLMGAVTDLPGDVAADLDTGPSDRERDSEVFLEPFVGPPTAGLGAYPGVGPQGPGGLHGAGVRGRAERRPDVGGPGSPHGPRHPGAGPPPRRLTASAGGDAWGAEGSLRQQGGVLVRWQVAVVAQRRVDGRDRGVHGHLRGGRVEAR
jgi:hypothetical protein